jgi:endonuclease/exonuclease/phosphatase family metal-dependent hydrolase
MTWNIKFGGARIDFFFDGWGNEVLMDEDVVLDNMQALADYIQLVDPDIMMLQEVDIDSKRSAYVDQVQYLLNHTNLNYGAYASQWKADFIPSDGLGRMNSGNAVLSKWEITSAKRIALPLIEEQDELTQYFYLKRNLLKTMINIEGIELPVFASHASAYDKDGTRDEQIAIIKEEVDLLDDAGSRFVLGADFNAIPPGSINYIASLFPDRPDNLPEDFELEDYDVTDLQEFYDEYYSAVPLEDYNAEEDGDYFSPYYTHSIKIIPGEIDWNRKLDYLFTNYNGWIADSDTTHQDTRELSDHCPVSAELEW